jgi:O-antigen/teichoic acid export membrane protein
MALAEPETTVIPFSGATVRLSYSGPLRLSGSTLLQPDAEQAGTTGRISRLWSFVRRDQMLRNSLYLIMNQGVQAALGFVFWIIAARIFTADNVGRASSLISATSLIAFLGLLGLNTTFIRYLPTAEAKDRLITAGLTLVAVCSGGIALVYVFFTPLLAPSISFIARSLPLALGFVLLTTGGGINVLTDSVFIAAEKAGYNAFVDGVVGGMARIILVVVLAGTGAFGIFCAATGGFTAAALASLLLIAKALGWRPEFKDFGRVLKPVIRFSGVNYVGNVLNLVPSLIVPLIVLDRIGAAAAAYYYIAFQLASVLYSAAFSVEQAFLAEGAHMGVIGKSVLVRSLRILLALCLPAFVLVILFGHEVLMLFGANYAHNAESGLIPLTAAALPIAAKHWSLTVLRLSNRLKAIVWGNIVYAVTISGLAWGLAPHGLGALAMAWPIGSSAGALVAGVAAIRAIRHDRPRQHRRLP